MNLQKRKRRGKVRPNGRVKLPVFGKSAQPTNVKPSRPK